MSASERPGGRDGDMAIVDIHIPSRNRIRLRTLLDGVHAYVIEEAAALPVLVA